MKKLSLMASPDQIERAKAKADKLGHLRNSIREGRGNFVGYLAQIAVADNYGWSEPDTFNFDVVAFDGSRLDVKAKKRSVPCQPHYEFSVTAVNASQECRGYIPVSVRRLNHTFVIEVMGWIPKDQFLMMAKFMKAGTPQPNMKNGVIRADCYNLEYEKLLPIAPPLVDWG